METMLAGQNILEIGHSIYINGMGQIMLEAPKQHIVRRMARQLQNDETMIDGRTTHLARITQNRDTNPTPTRQMEAETFEESSEFRHCILALEHNRISRQCVQQGGVSNILMFLG